MKNSLDELMDVLETIRSEKHPEIPANVVKTIAVIQRDNQESIAARQGRLKAYFDRITESAGEWS